MHACEYRNQLHFKTTIYFHLGGLDLYPQGAPIWAAHVEPGSAENPPTNPQTKRLLTVAVRSIVTSNPLAVT